MKKDRWIWMPHTGHFISGHLCKFTLNTYVGGYIVSTVGEIPDCLHPGEFREIGCNRKYETMVFKAKKSTNKCCPYKIITSKVVDFAGYNEDEDAYKGHLEFCKKWSNPSIIRSKNVIEMP